MTALVVRSPEGPASPVDHDELTCRVRLWFGPHLLGEYATDAGKAQTYADVMAFQFHGLRVTTGWPETGQVLEPLPPRRLWPLTAG